MTDERGQATSIQIQVAKGRPLTGAILGLIIGLAVALLLQQQGIWPLDKITVFLLPAIVALIAILLTTIGRRGASTALTIALILTLPAAIWGATGLTSLDEQGELNGGCQVTAASDIDATTVTDTAKNDPFRIDPNGGLSWEAVSPVVFEDYDWEIWVEIAGAQVTLDSDHEDNEGGSQVNDGDVANITTYAKDRDINIDQLRGVYKVGGDAADTCDGFGFVKLEADPLETIIAKIALGIAIAALIILLLVAFTGRTRPVEAVAAGDVADGETPSNLAAGATGGDASKDASEVLGETTDDEPPEVAGGDRTGSDDDGEPA